MVRAFEDDPLVVEDRLCDGKIGRALGGRSAFVFAVDRVELAVRGEIRVKREIGEALLTGIALEERKLVGDVEVE
jgi:hypothetical protein